MSHDEPIASTEIPAATSECAPVSLGSRRLAGVRGNRALGECCRSSRLLSLVTGRSFRRVATASACFIARGSADRHGRSNPRGGRRPGISGKNTTAENANERREIRSAQPPGRGLRAASRRRWKRGHDRDDVGRELDKLEFNENMRLAELKENQRLVGQFKGSWNTLRLQDGRRRRSTSREQCRRPRRVDVRAFVRSAVVHRRTSLQSTRCVWPGQRPRAPVE